MLNGVAPHPNPLPQGEREPEVASVKRVIANSTVSGQNLVGSHGGRRHAGVSGSPNSGFRYFSLPHAGPVPVKSWSCTSWFGQWSPDPPSSATAGPPVSDRRRVTWGAPVSRTAGSGDRRRTKSHPGIGGSPERSFS